MSTKQRTAQREKAKGPEENNKQARTELGFNKHDKQEKPGLAWIPGDILNKKTPVWAVLLAARG